MSDKVLEMQAVGKTYRTPLGSHAALCNATFTLHRGDFAAITGPSGAGKTTLLNLAGLLDHPSCGDILFQNRRTAQYGEKDLCRLRRDKIGFVFQSCHLFPNRTLLDNVLFRFRYTLQTSKDARHLAWKTLEEFGLSGIADRPARLLSGGEMQRAAIARAVVLPPELLLVDEPTGNLDGESIGGVAECLMNLNQRKITILMATHNTSMEAICTRHFRCQEGVVSEH